MTTELLQQKMSRYLCGESKPAEARQIQNWLSSTSNKNQEVSAKEKARIENEIIANVKAYVDYSLLNPMGETTPWWKKITAFF